MLTLTTTNPVWLLTALLGAVVVALVFFRRRSLARPHVSQLWIFPVKSCAGVRVRSATMDALGLVGDRRFVMIDRAGNFVNPRLGHPETVLIQPRYLEDGSLELRAPNMREALHVPLNAPTVASDAKVWAFGFAARVFSDPAVEAWLSAALPTVEGGVRLATTALAAREGGMAPVPLVPLSRDAAATAAATKTSSSDTHPRALPDENGGPPDADLDAGRGLAFPDEFNLLAMCESSVAALADYLRRHAPGGRVPPNLDCLRFRANIVVRGAPAFDEDWWRVVRFGPATPSSPAASRDADLFGVKPCTRCRFTTVDYATGTFDAQQQPVRALHEFRKQTGPGWAEEGACVLGMHLSHRRVGVTIREGDLLHTIERHVTHRSPQQKAAAAATGGKAS